MTKTLIYGIIALIVVIIAALIAFVFTPSDQESGNVGNESGFFESLFPFNGGGEAEPLFERDNNTGPLTESEREAPILRQVSQDPVSGAFIFDRDGQTVIRFINRASGHVYETVATSTKVTRITNTTVPGIQETLWFDENSFIVRYLNNSDEIETFFARLSPDAEGEQRLNGFFLDSYTRAAIDPQKENLLSLVPDGSGSALLLSDPDGENAREVFNSPLTSWVPLQSENNLFVYSAPLSGFEGFLYQIRNGGLVKVAGNIPGLTAKISPSGKYALISSGGRNTVELVLLDTETGITYESPVTTLSDKCAFSNKNEEVIYCGIPNTFPEGAYPNDWLLGRVSFSDSIWAVDPRQEAALLISDPENDISQQIDVWRPMINPSETHFIFINKNDLSLWSLQLPSGENN